ncbi:methyl-accepting chemotaxis protein (MCP) signaling protein [Hypnocyclicus thermotrophus]|uniref:Methyl-accepting chemotaxis protein (MCP) signaling protein n=1 Tax=Hypnocyclicus thermotrophus TaxID=1627895 RepID=A0AA46I6K1_9FUSO|nr:methyl-accepting chemotaxis protein [Hypnocyclicus thermotrophus]TDT72476.1 methyl-accepting chemotaxis protein (MCP) signaling protein [Hypnocyclicus thermotrophus]
MKFSLYLIVFYGIIYFSNFLEKYNFISIIISIFLLSFIYHNSKTEEKNYEINHLKEHLEEIYMDNKALEISLDSINSGENEELTYGLIHLKNNANIIMEKMTNQSNDINEALSSIEQISTSSATINVNAQYLLEISNKAKLQVEESKIDINSLNKNMNLINNSIQEANEKIDKLISTSKNIGNIVFAINKISEQTNLLALNAAIEAARAGEAGKGFSVVADEIRKLAEQTNIETQKIENLIKDIQNNVSESKNANDTVSKNVETGLKINNIVFEKINNISQTNDVSNTKTKEIVNFISEQMTAIFHIKTAIESISKEAEETKENSEFNLKLITNLSNLLNQKIVDLKSTMEKLDKIWLTFDDLKINI